MTSTGLPVIGPDGEQRIFRGYPSDEIDTRPDASDEYHATHEVLHNRVNSAIRFDSWHPSGACDTHVECCWALHDGEWECSCRCHGTD